MHIQIREATEEDFAKIMSLIKELAKFEKAEDKVSNSLEQMKEEKDFFECFVAETQDKEIVGIALYFFAYFTWVGKTLYLDDLYVKKEFRRNQIATKLIEKIFQKARLEKCKGIKWQVLNWNKPAIEFYNKLGFTIDKEWYNCYFKLK